MVIAVIAMIVTGIFFFLKYRQFTGYTVTSVVEMSNSEENTHYYPYGRGYLKCAGDGITYFKQDGIIWSENYSMTQPIVDICEDYIAVADMTQRNIYLYDKSGYVNRINLSHSILDVEVSKAGVIAVASNEGNLNYIEIRDRKGNEIMTEKSVFSSSGFLMDLSLSEDGERLAAVFVSIQKGIIKSKVVFYDLSGNGESKDIIRGTFDRYESVLLTTVQFMENDYVCVVGDTVLSMYRFQGTPELVFEEPVTGAGIQSLFFSDRFVGMILEETDASTRYCIRVLNTAGEVLLEQGTDFSYGMAFFAGRHVVLYSYNECLMYSLSGIEKLYCAFDRHIEALCSTDGLRFVYGTNADTEFIALK